MATSPTPPSLSLPTPQSYEAILGQALSSYASAIGVDDLNVGAPNVAFFQVVSLMIARASGDIFSILRDFNLSRASGPALQNLAIEYGVPPLPAITATGAVTVTDLSFQKISTVIYAGTNPPNIGSTTIYISNGASFPATGAIYIGRGTVDIEGPISYTAVNVVGTYYSISLSSPTTKFHNLGETVILAQGGVRTVPVNTIVVSPGVGTTASIQYSVSQQGTILDGETTVTNVPITALLPGSTGNVPAGAISQFSGNPSGLPNASVTNPLAITTGQDLETDDQLRVRVKNALASTGLGTVTAIESALQGVQSPTSSDTIVSTDVLNSATNTTVYIDNGSGYEATHTGVAIEAIVNSALGGEKFFQLVTNGTQTSVTKAFLQSVAAEPFDLSGGEVLTVIVGDITYNHTFIASDFANPGSATAYEVCASINGDTSLNFEAVTAGGGTYVVIRPEDEVTNTILVTTPANSQSVNANSFLQFPAQEGETLRLYKNNVLLSEDGNTASIFTLPQSSWSSSIASGETLSLVVDGTTPVTYTLTNAMFVAEGTYTSLSYSNSLQSWVNVFNENIAGITASIVGSTIELTSNLGATNRAEVTILNETFAPQASGNLTLVSGSGLTPLTYTSFTYLGDGQYAFPLSGSATATAGAVYTNNGLNFTVEVTISGTHMLVASGPISYPTSLIGKGMFGATDLTSTGSASDYILDRNTAQIELVSALSAGDSLSAGSTTTEANIKASLVSSGAIVLSSPANVWISIDSPVTIIPTLQKGSGLTITPVAPNKVSYTSVGSSAFANVLPGDYAIIWSLEIPSGDRLEGRVHSVSTTTLSNDTITIEVTAAEYALATSTVNAAFIQGFVVARTVNVPQKFVVASATYANLQAITSVLQAQSDQVTFGVYNNTNITVTDNTLNTEGSITVVTADSFGASIGFVGGVNNQSQTSLLAYYETQATTAELPLFFHSPISADTYANPPTSFVTAFTSSNSLSSLDPNDIVSFLNPYGGIDDEQPYNENVQISTISGTAVTIAQDPDVRRLRTNDRFYVANPLDFGYNDSVIAIVDGNSLSETYTMPLYRRAIVNSNYAPNNYSFDAYDVATGPTASFSTNFTGFNFANFKALLQAKYVVQAAAAQTALLFRSTTWGRSGTDINISYAYPTSANQSIGSVVTITPTNNVNIAINLMSGNPISTSISSTTQWNVTVTANTPSAGIDQVTYTYNGTGTAPNLPGSLGSGAYVTILPSTGFNVKNTGTFRISTAAGYTPTSTAFSVQVAHGTAFAQSNVVTGVPTAMYFYASSSTTAAAINTYVNANLSQYITATIVNDGGMTGSGVIVLSTYEGSGFTVQSYYLKDGINWIASSNTTGNPQFTFKEPLTYVSDTGYSFFTSGDEVRLIPTTMEQVKNLWNVLAVTGITTVGTVETADRGNKLQIATNTIGSVGSIEIVGGSGNEYVVPILTSGELLGVNSMIVSASSIASAPVASDQWFRLQAQTAQNKDTGIANNTSVTVASNTPVAGQSTVTLLNQTSTQLYFGAPRNFTTVSGSTFRIEKQGSLTCLSWTGVGSTPVFSTAANLNDSGGWTVNVTSNGVYSVASGATTFSALSIGDLITITGCANAGNNGQFYIEGVTATTFTVSNPSAVNETGTAITAGEFSSTLTVMEGDTVAISSTSPFASLNQGQYRVVRLKGTSIWYENANSVEEEQSCTSNTQIQFYQYEATVPGDKLVVNGTVLGAGNAGSYGILSITSPTVAIINGTISSQTNTSLSGNSASLNVVEGVPYTGYKHIKYIVPEPGTSSYNSIVFTTPQQYEKINPSAGVAMTSLSKLNFPTTIRLGTDAYSYDTGLIGQANRVIYGDPSDPVTYPGVNAAGTDIFIREPLLKSISIALAIRTNIGVSFPQITSQIQSSVYALIQSNPLGQSIALSSIVETVQAIPGILSVVITNPSYSVANDEIVLTTGEKAFIVNQVADITVSLIGSA